MSATTQPEPWLRATLNRRPASSTRRPPRPRTRPRRSRPLVRPHSPMPNSSPLLSPASPPLPSNSATSPAASTVSSPTPKALSSGAAAERPQIRTRSKRHLRRRLLRTPLRPQPFCTPRLALHAFRPRLPSLRRAKKPLPTTVAGLLVHVADHTQRHVGQAITTLEIGESSAG